MEILAPLAVGGATNVMSQVGAISVLLMLFLYGCHSVMEEGL